MWLPVLWQHDPRRRSWSFLLLVILAWIFCLAPSLIGARVVCGFPTLPSGIDRWWNRWPRWPCRLAVVS